jgi:hypothetical protein
MVKYQGDSGLLWSSYKKVVDPKGHSKEMVMYGQITRRGFSFMVCCVGS